MHEEKKCVRCGNSFECKAGSISLCQCSNIILTEEERHYVEQRYVDCLCINCLRILQANFQQLKNN